MLAADAAALELIPCWQQALVACSAYLREQQELNNMLGFDDLESIRAVCLVTQIAQDYGESSIRFNRPSEGDEHPVSAWQAVDSVCRLQGLRLCDQRDLPH